MLLALAAIPPTPLSAATTYYVGAAGDGAGVVADCGNQVNTDCTLRDALAVATSGGDTVAFGTSFPSGTQTIAIAARGTLAIAHTVALIGPASQTVVIDGGYDTTTHTGGVRIFDLSAGSTFSLSNLTIRHGSALGGSTATGSGGGVRVASDSALSVANCVFDANAATLNGGAIYGASIIATGTGGTVGVAGSTFTGNAVLAGGDSNGGGAISVLNGLLTVTNSTFTGNIATSNNGGNLPGGGAIRIEEKDRTAGPPTIGITGGSFASNGAARGGAIWDDAGLLTATNVAFANNTASGDTSLGAASPVGGAIFQGAGTLTLTGGSFATNSASPALSGSGGAIALWPGGALGGASSAGIVVGTTFTGNTAGQGGAINVYFNSSLSISRSTLASNTGGAIYQQRATTTIVGSTFVGNAIGFESVNVTGQTSTATIINSTFSGNTGSGGVLSDNATTTRIINSTLYANSIDIYQWATCCSASPSPGGAVTLINTLVGGSAASGGDLFTDSATPGAVFLGHHNLIDDAATAGPFSNGTANNIVGVPAGVGALGNNGGPTQTRALLASSAAIGTGDTTVCAAAPPNGAGGVDQRALPRPAGACSIGAFEPQPTPNPLPPPQPTGVASPTKPAPLPGPQPPSATVSVPAPLPPPRA